MMRRTALRAGMACALGMVFLLSMSEQASARQDKRLAAATVVETAEYIPCGDRCSAQGDPVRTFCLRAGNETLVGDGRSFLHLRQYSGMEDYGGKAVRIRWNNRWIWMVAQDGTETKLMRGSGYEEFKDRGCVAAVNRPILARAYRQKRPASVPATAVAIAGPEHGDNPQRFLWYDCAMGADKTIQCRRWYRNGDSFGDDWYCAKTLDGDAVETDFAIDPLESEAGHLVLRSGGVLEHDQRNRIDGKLERPGSPCY